MPKSAILMWPSFTISNFRMVALVISHKKTDGSSAHEYDYDDCGEHCLVKHDVVQFQVSVNNSMLARKCILSKIFLDFF